jgi:pyruvate/2-oxoglutarate dehydrogenase complex dihydrolipoamide acyltransferase (E2) component
MNAAEEAAGTINESSTDDEAAATPPMSKKEAKEAAKAAAKQEEKMAQKALKKKAKQMGITVEELEAMESRGGDDDDMLADVDVPEAVNGEVRTGGLYMFEFCRVLSGPNRYTKVSHS